MAESSLMEKIIEKKVNPFILSNGMHITSLKELRDYLTTIPNNELAVHFAAHKNDFEKWVRHSLQNPELADQMRKENTSSGMIRRIDYFLNKKSLQNLEDTPGAAILPPTGHSEEAEPVPYPGTPVTPLAGTEERPRVKIGIPGMDDLITKGVPCGSSVLISGGPGTGKTTFCLQLLNEASEKGERCLYLTFEEDVRQLKQHMVNYGWNPEKLEKEGKLIIKKMQPFDLSRSVEALLAKASGELTIELDEIEGIIPRGFQPDRIVLDSLSAVAAAFIGQEQGYRIYVEQLFTLFKNIGATSFLITEIEQDTGKYSRSGVEEFLADAVFVFYNIRQKNIRMNALEILKIRGTSHQKKIVPFKIISDQGIVVYPKEEVFT